MARRSQTFGKRGSLNDKFPIELRGPVMFYDKTIYFHRVVILQILLGEELVEVFLIPKKQIYNIYNLETYVTLTCA